MYSIRRRKLGTYPWFDYNTALRRTFLRGGVLIHSVAVINFGLTIIVFRDRRRWSRKSGSSFISIWKMALAMQWRARGKTWVRSGSQWVREGTSSTASSTARLASRTAISLSSYMKGTVSKEGCCKKKKKKRGGGGDIPIGPREIKCCFMVGTSQVGQHGKKVFALAEWW